MPELYSHSRLSNFETCPKKFHYRYVLKVPTETEGIEGFMGKRVHEVLERLYIAVGRGHVPSLAQVVNRFGILWEEHFDPATVRIVRSEHPPSYYKLLGERCLANYYRRHYPFDGDRTLGIEKRVAFSLDDAGQYRVQGIIDRVVRARDGVIEIHDYKTGKRKNPIMAGFAATLTEQDREDLAAFYASQKSSLYTVEYSEGLEGQ